MQCHLAFSVVEIFSEISPADLNQPRVLLSKALDKLFICTTFSERLQRTHAAQQMEWRLRLL